MADALERDRTGNRRVQRQDGESTATYIPRYVRKLIKLINKYVFADIGQLSASIVWVTLYCKHYILIKMCYCKSYDCTTVQKIQQLRWT